MEYTTDINPMYGYNDLYASIFGTTFWVVFAIMMIILIIANWKIFEKAGIAGWKCLIPFYNTYCMYKLVFGSGWLFLLQLIPIVNIVISFVFLYKFVTVFGHGLGYMLGLIFLSPVFYLILAFGSSEYEGPLLYQH